MITLAQAPAATIAGAVSIDPSGIVTSRQPICCSASVKAEGNGFRYDVPKQLPGFWEVGLTAELPRPNRDYVIASHSEVPLRSHEITTPGDVSGALRSLIEPHLPAPKTQITNISRLPLTILGVGHPSNIMAVVMSGDGGWRDLDKPIAESLQRQGIPVVGWDTLRYFWSKKTSEQSANDLAAVMRISWADGTPTRLD